MVGNYTAAQNIVWSVTSDGSGGADVTETAPVTDEWTNTNGGSWTVPANWGLGTLPSSTENVLIDQPGSGAYTVTIPNGTAATANSLTLNSANVTLSDQGTLTLNGAMSINAGTLNVSGSITSSSADAIDATYSVGLEIFQLRLTA